VQEQAEHGPEDVIHRLGSYQRLHRDSDRLRQVMGAERALLDVCVSAFADRAARYLELLTEPPHRYRFAWPTEPSGRN
jgi:hypothetical protein